MDTSEPSTNGQVTSRSPKLPTINRQSNAQGGTWFSRLFRLSIWFTILTILFRCPSSPDELNAASPRVCKPYFTIKAATVPYAQPYYDVYLSSYVEAARPYADQAKDNVYTPSVVFVQTKYDTYAAPGLAQAKAYGDKQWTTLVLPKCKEAQTLALDRYQIHLDPYVKRAQKNASPYWDTTQKFAQDQYQSTLLPAYTKAEPYVRSSYNQAYMITVERVIPTTRWAGENVVIFIQRKLWPSVRVAYGENVQPQLFKIRERLASYREGKKLKSAADEAESDASVTGASHSASTQSAPSTGRVSPEVARKVTDDLSIWKTKFTKAAEQGAQDLRQRLAEISSKQMEKQANGTGKAHVVKLEETVKTSFTDLKDDLIGLIAQLSDDATDKDEEDIAVQALSAIRGAGQKVKEEAKNVRAWRYNFDDETDSLVNSATDSTLDIVDNIRNLGLQEIGMRWASMEGVSYKDWAEYHSLRNTFAEWRESIVEVANDHKGLKKAKQHGEEIESRGMVVAEDAAKELARLKDVVDWKIQAKDTSNDWTTRYTPAGAAKSKQKILDRVADAKEAASSATKSQGTIESISSQASSAASSAMPSGEGGSSRRSDKKVDPEELKSRISENAQRQREGATQGTAPPSSDSQQTIVHTDTVEYAATASSKAASVINAAGSDYSSVTSSLGSKAAKGSPSPPVAAI
ncbi:MAG: hypothetical protein M1831_000076 [Alyxoria varia]|nr:MAG: hypothetical protein M1831_000076 [Alyxoria varia]